MTGTGNINLPVANDTNADLVATITVTPTYTNNGVDCTGPSEQFTITVNPTPDIIPFDDLFIPSGSSTNEVTLESNSENTTFSWVAVAESGIIGLVNTSSNGTTNIIPSETLSLAEGISTPLDVVYTIIPICDGNEDCEGTPYTYTVTVNPLTGVSFIDDIVVCNGDFINNIEFTSTTQGGETTYEWVATGDAIGLDQTDDGSGLISGFTADNLTSEPLITSITVTPTFTNGGVSSEGDPLTFTITVNPTAQVDPVDSLDLCNGDTAVVDFTTSNGGVDSVTTYSWEITGGDSVFVGGVLSDVGNINLPVINETNADLVATITVTPTYTNDGVDCTGPSEEFTITVSPTAQVEQVNDIVVCNGDEVAEIVFATTSENDIAYSWSIDTEIGTQSLTGVGNIPLFEAENIGTDPVVATVTVTPSNDETDPSLTCEGSSIEFTITVNPTAQVDPVDSLDLCNGDTAVVDFTTSNGGVDSVTTYSWEITGDSVFVGGALSDVGNINLPVINETNADLVATITVTPTYTNDGVDCTGPSEEFMITVSPTAQVEQVNDIVVCNGDEVAEIVFATTSENDIAYSWSIDTEIGTQSLTGVGNIPLFEAENIGTDPVVATVTVTPSNDETDPSLTCEGSSIEFTITVNPTAQVDSIDLLEFCDNDDVATINFTTSNTGGLTSYLWENTGGVDIGLGSNGGSVEDSDFEISFDPVNTGLSPISTEITVTPFYANGDITCSEESQIFTITVNPTPDIIPFDDLFISSGSSTNEVTLESNSENTTFSWVAVAESGILGLVNTSSNGTTNIIPSETLSLAEGISAPLDVVYTITPIYDGNEDCEGTPYTYTVTVNPTTGVSFIDDIVVCNGDFINNIEFTSTTQGGETTYEWVATGDNIGLDQTDDGSGLISGFTADNLTSEPLITSITVTPTFTNGGVSSEGDPLTFTITVNPTAQVDPVDSLDLCNGDTAVVDFTTSNGGVDSVTTYSWEITGGDSVFVGGALSDVGNINLPVINETNADLVATITVTPTYTNDGVDCTGPSEEFTITVSPTAQVEQVNDIVVCNGDEVAEIVFATTSENDIAYSWSIDTEIGTQSDNGS